MGVKNGLQWKSENPDDKRRGTPILGRLQDVGDAHHFHWYNLRVKGLKS